MYTSDDTTGKDKPRGTLEQLGQKTDNQATIKQLEKNRIDNLKYVMNGWKTQFFYYDLQLIVKEKRTVRKYAELSKLELSHTVPQKNGPMEAD